MDSCISDSAVARDARDERGRSAPAHCKVEHETLYNTIVAHFGVITYVAMALGISRQAVYKRIDGEPELQAAVDGARKVLVGVATTHLRQALKAGAEWAVHFFMCREEGVWVPMKKRPKLVAAPAGAESDEPRVDQRDRQEELSEREEIEPQPEQANRVLLRLIRAVDRGEPWAVRFCLNHLEPRGKNARKPRDTKGDTTSGKSQASKSGVSVAQLSERASEWAAGNYDGLLGRVKAAIEVAATTVGVVTEAPTCREVVDNEVFEEAPRNREDSSGPVTTAASESNLPDGNSAPACSLARPLPYAHGALMQKDTTSTKSPHQVATTLAAQERIPAEEAEHGRKLFREKLSGKTEWTVDLQVQRLEYEERNGRRQPVDEDDEEDEAEREVDPDDLRSPEAPWCTVGQWRRIKAFEASPEGIARAKRKAEGDIWYAKWQADKAIEEENRVKIQQQEAEMETADAEKAAADAEREVQPDRINANSPHGGMMAIASDGRKIPMARGHSTDIWINR